MKILTSQQLIGSFADWPSHMQRSIELAATVFNTTPNPRVGCVIVKDGEIVGEGWHSAAGQKHAEIVALERAGELANSSTAFVSLEPCAHTGRTPPCTKALISAGIGQVVIASVDPDERVSGRGIAALESANIEVFQLKDFDEKARAINPGFFKRHELGVPFVRLKLAMSIDGRTALSNGESKWITSEEARRDVQKLRAKSCAIVTGMGTVLLDNPALTVRTTELGLDEEQLEKNKISLSEGPIRVVVGDHKKIPDTAKIIGTPGSVKLFTSRSNAGEVKYANNVEVIPVDSDQERVNLRSVLVFLASQTKCNEVLVEAGPTLSAEFIKRKLVDEFIVYSAPKILGSDSRPLISLTGLSSLDEAINFSIKEVTEVGSDIKTTFIPN